MALLALTLSLVGLHLLVFSIWLRDVRALKSERGIFAYHFWFGVVCSSLAIAISAAEIVTFAHAAAAIAINGIYALSFLELWSLSQGSYSLSILMFGKQRSTIAESDLAHFTELGDAKLHGRVTTLLRLKLVSVSEERIQLTLLGKLLAAVLIALARVANVRRTG